MSFHIVSNKFENNSTTSGPNKNPNNDKGYIDIDIGTTTGMFYGFGSCLDGDEGKTQNNIVYGYGVNGSANHFTQILNNDSINISYHFDSTSRYIRILINTIRDAKGGSANAQIFYTLHSQTYGTDPGSGLGTNSFTKAPI